MFSLFRKYYNVRCLTTTTHVYSDPDIHCDAYRTHVYLQSDLRMGTCRNTFFPTTCGPRALFCTARETSSTCSQRKPLLRTPFVNNTREAIAAKTTPLPSALSVFSLETHNCSKPRVLQIDQYATQHSDTLLLHPSLPLLAGFPLSLVPLASATLLASDPSVADVSAVMSSPELQVHSSPLLQDVNQRVAPRPVRRCSSAQQLSFNFCWRTQHRAQFIDADETLGLPDTTRTSGESISTAPAPASNQNQID